MVLALDVDANVNLLTLYYHWFRFHVLNDTDSISICMRDDSCLSISMVSRQKGPYRHAYAWQIGPFWQETLDITFVGQVYYMLVDVYGENLTNMTSSGALCWGIIIQ